MDDTARAWAKQIAIVFGVFTVLGFLTAAAMFAWAPNGLLGSAFAAASAGLGGATGWTIIRGRRARPSPWRAILAGVLGGVLVHLYFWTLGAVFDGPLSPFEILVGSLFTLMVLGIITVPAGVMAALYCLALIPESKYRNARTVDDAD